MSTVYKAEHRLTDKSYAVKVLHPNFQRHVHFGNDFAQEGRKMARLNHPNIIHVHHTIESEPYCIIMDYFEGKDLGQFIRGKGKLSEEETLTIGVQIASALIHMREVGIIHCDLHTGNIRVQQEDKNPLDIRIFDLGIAAMMTRGQPVQALPLGTLQYISPERVKREKVDDKSDIFSLGLLLHEMLTGCNHFYSRKEKEEATRDIMDALTDDTKELPLLFPEETPDRLKRLIFNLVKKDSNQRLPLEDFIREANKILHPRWNALLPVVVGMTLIIIIAAGGYFRMFQKEASPASSIQGQNRDSKQEAQPDIRLKEGLRLSGSTGILPVSPAQPESRLKGDLQNSGKKEAERNQSVVREGHQKEEGRAQNNPMIETAKTQAVPLMAREEIDWAYQTIEMKMQLRQLKRAYEDEDLALLNRNTKMSEDTLIFLKDLFEGYSNIKIWISDPLLSEQGLFAVLEITSLTNSLGNQSAMAEKKSKTTLQFQNIEGAWRVRW
jgi:serine/threonine protein kinase